MPAALTLHRGQATGIAVHGQRVSHIHQGRDQDNQDCLHSGRVQDGVPGLGSGTLTLQQLSQTLLFLREVVNRAQSLEHLGTGLSMRALA